MPKRGYRKPKQVIGDPSDLHGMAVKLQEFLEWMRIKNYSDRTVGNRELYLGYFIGWAEERGVTRPSEVTKPILERYQRYLYHYRKPSSGEALSFRSQYTRLVPVRAFFKWLTKYNHILYNPASELELPKLEKRLPKHVLTQAEAEQVLMQTNVGNPMGIRDRGILEVLYSTGMRRMELIGLNRYDLDVDRGTLMIRQGKGKKDRMVPIGERAIAWCEKYLYEVRPTLTIEPDEGVFFLTAEGESLTPNRLTQLVRNYVNAAEITKKGACHLFRHTMATLMLENGADIRFIQQMLGHADLSTTQIYTQVSIRQLKEIHSATHPAKFHREDKSAESPEEQNQAELDELYSSLAAEEVEENEDKEQGRRSDED
jgi:integrase/recombinase XerD